MKRGYGVMRNNGLVSTETSITELAQGSALQPKVNVVHCPGRIRSPESEGFSRA